MERNKKTPGVNFLKKQQSILKLQSKRLTIIGTLSLVVLLFYGAGLIALIIYTSYLSLNLKKFENDIEAEKMQIVQMEATREKYYLLKEKISAIAKASGSFTQHQDIIEKIFSFFPEGMEVSGIDLSENGEVNFKVTANSMKAVEELLSNIRNEKVDEKVIIEKASVTGFNVNSEGKYSFGVNLLIFGVNQNS